MNKTYQPNIIENKYRQFWSDNQLFCSETSQIDDKSYCIMLPPPNVTGSLHMGHAFQHTIMDVLTRYHRMLGHQTLWQPGTDHAGIATQMVVERQLNAQEISRHELGREAFIDKIWQWKKTSGGRITEQMKRLGASVDWDKERFTMDEKLSKAVSKAFVDLHKEGLIYRGKRLVNWDPVLLTAVSDLEVVNIEEQGFMYFVRYPLFKESGYMRIATTRPETILADGALAVNPNDPKYAQFIGKKVHVPLTDRVIPIVADDYVDSDFGTGCVKITPAHDFNDWQVGLRHQMEVINLMTPDAKMNKNAPLKYQGLDRFDAREQIIQDLQKETLLEKIEPHTLKRPRGDRTNAIIEPYLTNQWFVKTADLAKPAIDAVQNGDIRFIPNNWNKTYYNWMSNIEDWCISRQIWWGHRIPAWYDNQGNIFVANTLEQAQNQAGDGVELHQDEDVLDTWFSSALWPFSTLGWPEKTQDLATFYPTSVLVTGFDIIFFWVARMIMFGLKFTGEVPFKDIYITGLIRDNNGQKMSKSKGNVLDPIDLIDGISLEDLLEKRTQGLMQPKMAQQIIKTTKKEFSQGIPAFGTDALRFTFGALASFGRDISFDLKRVEGYRNFCNKLWNAARFVLTNLDKQTLWDETTNNTNANQWIISRLEVVKQSTKRHIEDYRLDLMSQGLYDFIWHDYCDWYLELAKPLLADEKTKLTTQQTLVKVLDESLKLLHPIIPFITEEIYQALNEYLPNKEVNQAQKIISLMQASYPTSNTTLINTQACAEIDWLKSFVLGVRKIRGEMNIPPNKLLPCFIDQATPLDVKRLQENQSILLKIAKLEAITPISKNQIEPESAIALTGNMRILIPLEGIIDKKAEILRLQKELGKCQKQHQQVSNKLNNEKFLSSAPKLIIKKEQEKLAKTTVNIDNINAQLVKMNTL